MQRELRVRLPPVRVRSALEAVDSKGVRGRGHSKNCLVVFYFPFPVWCPVALSELHKMSFLQALSWQKFEIGTGKNFIHVHRDELVVS